MRTFEPLVATLRYGTILSCSSNITTPSCCQISIRELTGTRSITTESINSTGKNQDPSSSQPCFSKISFNFCKSVSPGCQEYPTIIAVVMRPSSPKIAVAECDSFCPAIMYCKLSSIPFPS